jgi:transcription antitermination factor NusG
MALAYFVVQTRKDVTEAKVERLLRQQKINTFFPHTASWAPRDKRKLDLVKTPYLPRYLFVELDLAAPAFYTVNNTPGVATVIYAPGGIPFPIPDKVMRILKLKTNPDGLVYAMPPPQAEPAFKGQIGDYVRLSDVNAYCGFMAEISKIDASGEITVELEAFGRMVPIKIRPRDVSELYPQTSTGAFG